MPASENLLRPKITLQDTTGVTTYHTYDSFNLGAADINIADLAIRYRQYEVPTAIFTVEDSGNTLNVEVKNGCKVLIDLGKTQGGLTRAFSGYVRQKQVLRRATGTFDMVLTCLGTQVRMNELVANFIRMAKRSSISSADPDFTDTTMQASTQFTDLLTDTGPVSESALTYTTTNVQTITDVVPSIKAQYSEKSGIANQIADAVGAVWWIDPNDDAHFQFPTSVNSGLTITDVPASTDHANTAYFTGGWSFIDSIQKADGFANRLYGRGGTELAIDAYSTTDTTTTSLYDRDLLQQFTPTDSFNAEAFSVLVSKVGTVTGKLKAFIRNDIGNTVGSAIASAVGVPTSSIGSSATQVQLNFNKSAGSDNVVSGIKYWLQLNKIGTDASNTIRWHRDTGVSVRNAYRTAGTFTVQNNSYSFVYGQLTSRRILAEASDSDSIDKYGVIEAVIDAPWINEGRAMDKYLAAILQWTAKPKRIIDIPQVTIPDTLVYPGTTAELIDTKTGFATGNTAEILEVGYNFDAQRYGIGLNKMSIKLVQYPEDEKLTART